MVIVCRRASRIGWHAAEREIVLTSVLSVGHLPLEAIRAVPPEARRDILIVRLAYGRCLRFGFGFNSKTRRGRDRRLKEILALREFRSPEGIQVDDENA